MSIVSDLKENGITVVKTDNFYKGIYNTERGYVSTYKASKAEQGIYFLETSNGNRFPCTDQTIYILSDTQKNRALTKAETERLARQGKILAFKSSELYAEYYDFAHNEELESCFRYGYSKRSRKYIEAIMQNIGLVNYTDEPNSFGGEEGEPSKFKVIDRYSLFMNSEATNIGKIKSNLWIAQTVFPVEDDLIVIKMYFNRKPSVKDLETAFAVRDFEMYTDEVFKCHECGHLTHWLDVEGSIEDKINAVRETYCGC